MKRACFLLSLLAWLVTAEARAQWLVYDMTFSMPTGVNLEVFEKAYLVLPVNGGPSSMVFYGPDKEFAVSRNGARYFPVIGKDERKYVFSAILHQGTSHGMYYMDAEAIPARLPVFGKEEAYVIPGPWSGVLTVCDSEADRAPAEDGTLGMAGSARLSAEINMPLTRLANVTPQTLEKILADLSTRLLERGYRFLSDSAESTAAMRANNPQIDPSLFPQ